MDLKKFLPKENEEQEYFWSLVIVPGWVSAGIWRIEKETVQIMITSSPCAWELDDELIVAADSALSFSIQRFPEGLKEPSKTVFGVSTSWVIGSSIKEEYLEKIKTLCSELSLEPVGFVVLPEAIAYLIKSEEGSPLNGIIIGVYKETIEISVFRLGNLLGTTEIIRSISFVDDVVEGLTRFAGNGSLPSRMILYDGKEGMLEETRQELLKVNWEDYERLKFLHTPKVEMTDSKRKIYAVSLAGASEIGNVTTVVATEKEPESLDVLPLELAQRQHEEEVSLEKLGFAAERDVADVKSDKEGAEKISQQHEESLRNVGPIQEEKLLGRNKLNLEVLRLMRQKFLRAFSVFSFFKKFGKVGGRQFLLAGGFLVAIFLIGFLIWWFYPQATVTLYVSPKKLEEKINIKVDPKGESLDIGQALLPGKEIEEEVTGEGTKETSGTKIVGEKSKGEVNLYRVGSQLTLEAGTILHGPDDLDFILDNTITIASGSAGSPGIASATVTAEDIGSQYNLASGTLFKVDNYLTSDIEAKNENAFSGGTSRSINVVSQEDEKVLQENLESELLEKAKQKLTSKLSEGEVFIDSSLVSSISSKTLSSKVGDEASTLKLSLTLNVKALTVERNKLEELSMGNLIDKVPEGFILRENQMEFEFNKKDKDNEFEVRVLANLLPKIDTEEIVKKIKGKYPDLALDILKETPGFVRAEIKIYPRFPGRLKTLPHVINNIKIEITSEN